MRSFFFHYIANLIECSFDLKKAELKYFNNKNQLIIAAMAMLWMVTPQWELEKQNYVIDAQTLSPMTHIFEEIANAFVKSMLKYDDFDFANGFSSEWNSTKVKVHRGVKCVWK